MKELGKQSYNDNDVITIIPIPIPIPISRMVSWLLDR